MRFRRRRHEYAERARQARGEAETSRDRLEETRRKVVAPLAEAGRRNQFADIIRRSLTDGGKA